MERGSFYPRWLRQMNSCPASIHWTRPEPTLAQRVGKYTVKICQYESTTRSARLRQGPLASRRPSLYALLRELRGISLRPLRLKALVAAPEEAGSHDCRF